MKSIQNEKVRGALNSLILSHPFFASICLQQEPVENNNLPTFAVDGKHLFYNDTFANSLTFDECKGVLAHEVSHLALLHHVRKGNREHKTWNKACDYAINSELVKSGFVLPKGALISSAFNNMSAEDIYRIIKQEEENNQGGKGDGSGQPNQKSDDEPTFGEVLQAADPDKAEEETKIQVTQAQNFAKLCGNMPASLDRAVDNAKQPKHNWREILNRFLTEICAKDYSWSRPNRRYISSGFILPSLYSKTTGNFILAIDTSGSISTAEVSIMVTEVLHCLEMLLEDRDNVELTVIYCDSAVQNVEVLSSANDKPTPKGGGGTLFSPVFNYIEKENIDCSALIYLSDGYTADFWDKTPSFPVLWGLICDNKGFNPPFGEIFKFDVNDS